MTSTPELSVAEPGAAIDREPGRLLLAALLLLRTALLIFVVGLTFLVAQRSGADFRSLLVYANVAIVGVDLITIVTLARLQRRRGRRLLDLIGRPRGIDAVWGLLVAAIALVAMLVANFVANLIVYQGPPPVPVTEMSVPLWVALWSMIIMPVTVAAAEETLYRGYAQAALTARYGTLIAVLVPAVFFGLQHAALSAGSWESMLARVITTFGIGIAFGVLRVWLKRLTPLIVGHWLFDVVGLGLPMLLVALA